MNPAFRATEQRFWNATCRQSAHRSWLSSSSVHIAARHARQFTISLDSRPVPLAGPLVRPPPRFAESFFPIEVAKTFSRTQAVQRGASTKNSNFVELGPGETTDRPRNSGIGAFGGVFLQLRR